VLRTRISDDAILVFVRSCQLEQLCYLGFQFVH
jgi:hypothetical protein